MMKWFVIFLKLVYNMTMSLQQLVAYIDILLILPTVVMLPQCSTLTISGETHLCISPRAASFTSSVSLC